MMLSMGAAIREFRGTVAAEVARLCGGVPPASHAITSKARHARHGTDRSPLACSYLDFLL